MRQKTLDLIDAVNEVFAENPGIKMTLRQVYYQLVAKNIVENTQRSYSNLSTTLVKARKAGSVSWYNMEDRGRQPVVWRMYENLPEFVESIKYGYARNVWQNQPRHIEVWLEKDALSGVFRDVVMKYGVTLAVGRGYNSWSAYHSAAQRFKRIKDKPIHILYFGDFDPSGEDIYRAIGDSLNFFGVAPIMEKVSLTLEDIHKYKLPPVPAKKAMLEPKRL